MWKGKTVGDEVLIANYNSKNRTVTDGHLTEIFSMVGQRYGYEDVKAEFSALTDFKVRWQRSYKWAIFTVSDYLDRAPDDVLENLAEVLFSKITGQDAEYGDVFLRYVTDKELMRTNRKDFLKRSRNLTKKSIGDYHDLKDRTIKINLCNMGKMLEFVTGDNPYAKAKIIWTKQSIDRTWVFKEEWKAIFGSATTVERVALVLCAGMGLRKNEVATLKLSDICGNTMTIRGKGYGAGKIVEKEIPKSVMAIIQAYLPERELILRKFGDRYHDTLIVPPFYSHGERTLNRYVGNLIAEASARAGVKATCHTFRRLYCMNLLDNGFELDTVRRMMRHSSVDITLESYVCADPRKLKTATDSVDDALFG